MQNLPFAAQQEQVNKFLEANRRLGAQMDSQQGTTRIIYDTTGNQIGLTQYSFFNEVASKVWPATNIDQNRFQPGEGMVIKEINLEIANLFGNDTFFSNTLAGLSLINFYVGNQRVLKDLPLSCFSQAPINPLNTPGVTNPYKFTSVRLRTNIVIPPQVQFRCDFQLPFATGTSQLPVNFKLSVKGYGKLFNPRQNY